jgi:Leucine-rich repeat (LRR) protein
VWPEFNQNLSTYVLDQSLSITSNAQKLTLPTNTSIFGLQSLEAKNIQFFPAKLNETLPNLIAIHLKYCSISSLSGDDFKSLKLQEITFVNCKIATLAEDTFSNQTELIELDLEGNLIQNINEKTFRDLTNLKFIRLHGNKLKNIGNSLQHLVNLQEIYLARNNLQVFKGDEFATNKKVQIVSMTSNNIRKLSTRLFSDKNDLQEVDLRDNTCIDGHYYQSNFTAMYERIEKKCSSGAKNLRSGLFGIIFAVIFWSFKK